MARDQAYRRAEKKIEEARRTGATELYLSGMKLTELPESLGQLTQLQELDLARNQLTSLPESLGHLTQLQTLDLQGNQLTALPEWLGQLTQLEMLQLNENQLGTSFHDAARCFTIVSSLPELRSLFLSGNRLNNLESDFPDLLRMLSKASNLTALFFSRNGLLTIPSEIGLLVRLETFFLDDNHLIDLPSSLGDLLHLRSLHLTNNTLNPELAAAYEQGLDAVKAYLRAKAEGTVVLNEAKLILIGEGEVGKTCLLDALRGKPWREHDTTHGVEIKPVVLTPRKAATLTLNGWDFGGQEVYRPTHQLFFTAPAVYLVVWKPREGVQQGAVEYWIETIKHRAGPEAKILVVATHGGPQRRQPDIEEEHLRGKYGKDTILGFFHVDSKPNNKGTRTGITKLKNAIARVATGLPNVGREVAESWSHVLTAVRERSRKDPYITYKQFQSLCRPRKVNHALAATYAGMLNEMGHAIHYTGDEELGKYMILKPDWLAKAISFVLDDKTTRDRHGLVDHDYLSKLWSNPPYKDETGYAKKLHKLFRGLMERFDLTYEVVIDPAAENGSGASLIAQLVPGKPPKRLPGWGAKPHAGDREQLQLCRIVDIERAESSNAEGLFYRLIVRLHKYSLGRENHKKSVHWQRGLMLDDGYNGRALIERVGNDVRITVRAAYPGFFLFELTKEVKWLVDHPRQGWPGLRCDVMVPCIQPCGLNKAGDGLFEVEKLIINTQMGILEVLCTAHGCSQVHRVAELMTNAPGSRRTRVDSLGENVEDVHEELRAIREDLKTMFRKGDWQFATLHENQRRLLSQTDEQFEALMQTLTDEARNGPRLFSFVPVNRNFFNLKKWTTEKFRLTLWCEHSRLPLPSEQLNGETSKRGVYPVEFQREWLVKAAPFLKFMGTTLGMVLPVVSPAAKVLTDDATYKRFGEELELGIKCAQSVLKGAGEAGGWLARSDDADFEPGDPMRAQADVLRELHSILKKKDPGFGGLVRVQNKRHEFLWVHKKFTGEY